LALGQALPAFASYIGYPALGSLRCYSSQAAYTDYRSSCQLDAVGSVIRSALKGTTRSAFWNTVHLEERIQFQINGTDSHFGSFLFRSITKKIDKEYGLKLGFGQGVQGRSGKLSPCMCKETHCTCASSP